MGKMRIFVTGGAGYVGSHVTMGFAVSGHKVLIYDNLSNCNHDSPSLLSHVSDNVEFIKGDILNYGGLTKAIRNFRPDVIIHLAAKKYVDESASFPDSYYQTNVLGTMNVLRSMIHNNVGRLVFSSTAAVYGKPTFRKVSESNPTKPKSVYARTKLICEQMIHDYHQCYGISATCLRYFNPIGSHPDFPEINPKSLMSVMMRVASGSQEHLEIFGDGSAVRDFIHVADVADAHLNVISTLGFQVFNIGTGEGTRVSDLCLMVEAEIGKKLPRVYLPKRPGDIDVSVADVSLIKAKTGWQTSRSIREAVHDAWKAETIRLSH